MKIVPRRCISDPKLRLFQYTAIAEFSRIRFLAAYPEQSTYSSADFLKRMVKWYARRNICVECVQTDNGFEFTNRFSNSKRDVQTLFEKTAAEKIRNAFILSTLSFPWLILRNNLLSIIAVPTIYRCDRLLGFLLSSSLPNMFDNSTHSFSLNFFLDMEIPGRMWYNRGATSGASPGKGESRRRGKPCWQLKIELQRIKWK